MSITKQPVQNTDYNKKNYVRPAMMVHEMEIEGAILQASGEASPADYGYDSRGRWE